MVKTKHSLEHLPRIPNARIAIVQSKWHSTYVDSLVTECVQVLRLSGCTAPDIHLLPGCLELPLAARRVLRRDSSIEAVIAFGAILKGDTHHFDMVTQECIRGFGQVMLEEDVPVIVGILPVLNVEQLEERCANDEYNKGIEAAVATAEVIFWRRENNLPTAGSVR